MEHGLKLRATQTKVHEPATDSISGDVPTLRRDLDDMQRAMLAAYTDEDMEGYEKASVRHAQVSTALKRALALRRREQ